MKREALWQQSRESPKALVDMDGASITLPNSETGTLYDCDTDRDFGYAVGITLVGCEKWDLTVEGRFVDETALHFNTRFRF